MRPHSMVLLSNVVHKKERALTLFFLSGTAITVLMDNNFLLNNVQSMDLTTISSVDIIRRIQYYVSYVSL